MKRSLLLLGLVLLVMALQATAVSAEHWCAGAYDSKLGTSFGSCPGPKH